MTTTPFIRDGSVRIRIESALARAFNEQREIGDEPRNDTWEGFVPSQMTLEQIFRHFNRVDESDGERLARIGYDLPSLSVGDVITRDDVQYLVRPIGFEAVSA